MSHNLLGGLCECLHDYRFRDALQPPTLGNPIDLPLGAFAIGTRCNQGCKGPAFDPAQHRIITPVEHLFHQAAHGGQVFRTHEQVSLRTEQMRRLYISRPEKVASRTGALLRGPGERFAGTGTAMPGNEEGRRRHDAFEHRVPL